jgi:hypothetical protein
MRYQRGKTQDWCEISGASELSMRELDSLYTADRVPAFAVALAVLGECHFERKGITIDPQADIMGLTLKQWDWLREMIFTAAREEALDPEA